MGQKSFFPPINWCCPVLPSLHSTHEATNYWQRHCAARGRFSQEALSSAQPNPPSPNPLLGKGSTLALLERCEFVSFWASSTMTTVPLKSWRWWRAGGGRARSYSAGGTIMRHGRTTRWWWRPPPSPLPSHKFYVPVINNSGSGAMVARGPLMPRLWVRVPGVVMLMQGLNVLNCKWAQIKIFHDVTFNNHSIHLHPLPFYN